MFIPETERGKALSAVGQKAAQQSGTRGAKPRELKVCGEVGRRPCRASLWPRACLEEPWSLCPEGVRLNHCPTEAWCFA